MAYLLERQRMDQAEEVEKVEIDLRKCGNQIGLKRMFLSALFSLLLFGLSATFA